MSGAREGPRARPAAALLLSLFLVSCAYEKTAAVPFSGVEAGPRLLGLSREAVSGIIPLSKLKNLEYRFEPPLELSGDYSLELDYGFHDTGGGAGAAAALGEFLAAPALALDIDGEAAWALPGDLAFLGISAPPGRLRYVVPVKPGLIRRLSLVWSRREAAPGGGLEGLVFFLKGIRLVPRRFGFSRAEAVGSVSPFVYWDGGSAAWVIDPPAPYRFAGGFEVSLLGAGDRVRVGTGSRLFEYRLSPGEAPAPPELVIPPGALPPEPYPVVFTGELPPAAFEIAAAPDRPFPTEPVPADPGLILAYPAAAWRDPRYELFRWPHFPSLLIFDTADYALQDRLFKRLAFFTEKAGFRGRLAPDEEIAALHGWNAHDYRAEDLARFFSAAAETGFPLSPEERELEAVLLGAGILRPSGEGGFVPGAGGIISISRESPDYLRSRFLIHEGFHGLFFIDEDFRDFSRRRWDALDRGAKRFIRSYFDYLRYDLEDSYLMVNEFMAYCLQQPVSQAGRYFGENLAGQLYDTWRRSALPPGGEAEGVWPEIGLAFSREAEAFSAYVNRRWGFAAGRLRYVGVRDRGE
jgi:hypothetical protein